MTQYIDKDALVAYIKASIKDIEVSQKAGLIKKHDANNRIILFKSILSFIDTLEVKEVDLEKEYKGFIKVDYNEFEKLFDDFCKSSKGNHVTSHDACMWFWELGLKSQKGE